jgi:small subunit ribosomal protein S4
MHGPKSRRKHTDYGLGLIEKQKLRYYYGLLERQFRGVYQRALRRRGVTGEQMLQILETRLDNVCYHLGFANTRAGARQLVSHGHVKVNGRKVNVPSYGLKVNDIIEIKNSNAARQLPPRTSEAPSAGQCRIGCRWIKKPSRVPSCGFRLVTRSSRLRTNRPSSNFIPASH